jgi:hypothetical protein
VWCGGLPDAERGDGVSDENIEEMRNRFFEALIGSTKKRNIRGLKVETLTIGADELRSACEKAGVPRRCQTKTGIYQCRLMDGHDGSHHSWSTKGDWIPYAAEDHDLTWEAPAEPWTP